jgi:hypothetical protein
MCQRRRFPEAANLYRSRERSDGGAAMIQRWWKRFLYGAGAGHHLERCPFCGQTFDIRDIGQVLLHRDHQLADDGPPAFEPRAGVARAAAAETRSGEAAIGPAPEVDQSPRDRRVM